MSGRNNGRRTAADQDAELIARCIELARRGEGLTSPNPMVGAIIARGGKVIAEAFHRRAGEPHAEALALRRAGPAARGATLYVNLEPCSHFGKTPPCVDAILRSGIKRVVASHTDPYHRVNGRGFARLRAAGITVSVGLHAPDARRLNERYLAFVRRGRPFVLIKAAMTLDGRIATASGASRWISSAPSRRRAHRLRSIHDAVMVGINTVMADNPRLDARGKKGARQPVRVIIDGRLRLSPTARLLSVTRGGPVLVYCAARASRLKAALLTRKGATVVMVPSARAGMVDLRSVLQDLARRRVESVMVEGGGELIASFLRERLADKVCLFVSPRLLGGRNALPVMGGPDVASLSRAVPLRRLSVSCCGKDLVVEGYFRAPGD